MRVPRKTKAERTRRSKMKTADFGLRGIAASLSSEEQIAIMYCVTYKQLNRRKLLKATSEFERYQAWDLKFHYLHACDMQHARFEFIMSRPNKNMNGVIIVGIAPAVGAKVEDKHGDRLSL